MDLKKKPGDNDENDGNWKTGTLSENIQKNLQNIMGNDDIFLELWEYIFKQTKEKIEKNEMEYIGEGKEWMVYKIEIELPNKEKKIFLAVKKRFDNNLKDEIHLQKSFYDVAKKSKTWVEIPETLWEVEAKNDKYFLMEYINGKTLFNLKIEKIAEYFYEKFHKKYPTFFKNLEGINTERDMKNINKASLFDFKTDKEARAAMYKIINMLNENLEPMLQKYTGVKIALLNKETYDKTMEKIYYDSSLHGHIFSQNDGREVQQKIKDFLHTCHQQGLFHRDLWGNPTNIMFTYKNDTIVPVIIDFWKAQKSERGHTDKEYERWEWPYGDQNETYVPDTNICDTIKSLSYHPPKREPGELYY